MHNGGPFFTLYYRMNYINEPLIIGISGGSGSGKTYLLKKLLNHYPASEICLVSMDHYYRPIEEQSCDENGEVNFDLPGSILEEELYHDIMQLRSGRDVQIKEYHFNQPGIEADIITFSKAPILVLEGLFTFHFSRIADLCHIKVFIESDEELSLSRRITRDAAERSLTKDQVLYQWNNHVKPAYDLYLLPYRSQADLIIENTQHEPNLDSLFERISQHKRADQVSKA